MPRKQLPRFERVKHYVSSRIASGRLPVGAQVPSEHDLVVKLGVSRMTVNRGLRELQAEGVLRRERGVGTFVAKPPVRPSLIEIRNIADEIAARGRVHSPRVMKLEPVPADTNLASFFGLRLGATVFHSIVVHHEDGVPIQLEERYVNPAFAPDYLRQDYSRGTTTEYLHTIDFVTEVEHTVIAIRPDARVRRLLGVDRNDACLRLFRQTWVRGIPTSKNLFTYAGGRHSLSSRYATGA